jgi:peptide/nickel transport system permease protein
MDSKLTPAQKERLYVNLGLDQPTHIQYIKWVGRMVQGDFGESLQYKKPVEDIVGQFIWNSFLLNIVVFFLAFLIAIPVGIKAAVKRYGPFDNFWSVFSLLGISMPTFFFGYILIFIFAVKLKILPMNGMVTAGKVQDGWVKFMDIAVHMILPATVLTIGSLASLIRYVRNSMIEVINQDYIRTARAKGLSERVVIYKHAFRNALIPIVTLIGLYIPGLFGGSVILERIFIWPGIGNVLYRSLMMQDTSMILAVNMFFAILMLLGNLIADVSYALVDPRVKTD